MSHVSDIVSLFGLEELYSTIARIKQCAIWACSMTGTSMPGQSISIYAFTKHANIHVCDSRDDFPVRLAHRDGLSAIYLEFDLAEAPLDMKRWRRLVEGAIETVYFQFIRNVRTRIAFAEIEGLEDGSARVRCGLRISN